VLRLARDAGTSEFSNLKTTTLETGITGGFPVSRLFALFQSKTNEAEMKFIYLSTCVQIFFISIERIHVDAQRATRSFVKNFCNLIQIRKI
jgi:hypothetical protein